MNFKIAKCIEGNGEHFEQLLFDLLTGMVCKLPIQSPLKWSHSIYNLFGTPTRCCEHTFFLGPCKETLSRKGENVVANQTHGSQQESKPIFETSVRSSRIPQELKLTSFCWRICLIARNMHVCSYPLVFQFCSAFKIEPV